MKKESFKSDQESEKKNIAELSGSKEDIYGEKRLQSELDLIADGFERAQSAYSKYIEGGPLKDMLDDLWPLAEGEGGEHSSAQIRAFELMVKSLADAQSTDDAHKIIEHVLFTTDSTEIPIKQEYLRGILAYYSSKEYDDRRVEQLREDEDDIKLKSEHDVYLAFQEYLQNHTPEELEVYYSATLIDEDFKHGEEGDIARLIAHYYSHEDEPTAPAKPKQSRILDFISKEHVSLGSTGTPKIAYFLHPDHATSSRKIEQADMWGVALHTEISELNYEDGTKLAIILDLNQKESDSYIREIRDLLDQEDRAGAAALRIKFKDEMYEKLPETYKKMLKRENCVIQTQTIRDESIKEALENGEVQTEDERIAA